MKILILASSLAIVMALAANAQTTGTLTITGELTGSMVLVIKQPIGGPILTGNGTPAASMALGTFSASTPDGTVSTGVTKGNSDATGFSLLTSILVNVSAANGASTSYSLAANIDNTDQLTYSVATIPIGTSATPIESGMSYGQDYPVGIAIRVPSTATTQSINRVITFTATAN